MVLTPPAARGLRALWTPRQGIIPWTLMVGAGLWGIAETLMMNVRLWGIGRTLMMDAGQWGMNQALLVNAGL